MGELIDLKAYRIARENRELEDLKGLLRNFYPTEVEGTGFYSIPFLDMALEPVACNIDGNLV